MKTEQQIKERLKQLRDQQVKDKEERNKVKLNITSVKIELLNWILE